MSIRKLQRKVAKAQMAKAGVEQPNKTIFKRVDDKGNATRVKRPSFFSQHWRDK